jgi:ketosteroid isomerase-like protein
MTESENLIAVAQQFYSLCSAGDFVGLKAVVTEDFRVREAEDLPFPGLYAGIDALQELFAIVMGKLSIVDMRQTSFLAGPDIVCAMVELVPEAKPAHVIEVAEVFRFRDGRICEIQPFWFDAASVRALAGA